jgi:hypothetical protein
MHATLGDRNSLPSTVDAASGKTYLVRRFFAAELRFELTGTRQATHKQQLANFAAALSARADIPYAAPRDWPEAFQTLSRYLDYVRKGRSAAQNTDAMFFAPQAPLHDEFENLYAALFEHHERHLKVIHALARKQSGLTRKEIISASKMPSGGNVTTILDELESSDFICKLTTGR